MGKIVRASPRGIVHLIERLPVAGRRVLAALSEQEVQVIAYMHSI